MKIAIIGSRGIPNNYGGFEQFAEYLSKSLVAKGHEVWVCNPHYHSYRGNELEGVHIQHVFNPETFLGTAGNFIYDFLCLKFATNAGPDIILMLGYTTSSVWFRVFSFKKSILVTNLDGLEWKRDKWGTMVKKLTRWFESLAVRYGGHLVADHYVIQDYFMKQHHKQTTYIPYGADVFNDPDENVLQEYHLEKNKYSLIIARLEAEHNIEMIIEGYLASGLKELLLLVGNHATPYGESLKKRYREVQNVRFMGGIYNMKKLNNLRFFSNFYFHGHSIGGTNPSLLEAMAAGALIIAHQNPFNHSILGDDAFYFSNASDISRILTDVDPVAARSKERIETNISKITAFYNWQKITDDYEMLFADLINTSKARENKNQSGFNQAQSDK